MRYLFHFAAIAILVFCTQNICAQTDAKKRSMTKTAVWNFPIPAYQESGPNSVTIDFEYYFYKEYLGGKPYASLWIKAKRMEFTNERGTDIFKYKGQTYMATALSACDGATNAYEGFEDVRITNVEFEVDIYGNALTIKRIAWNNNFENYHHLREIKEDDDMNHFGFGWVLAQTKAIHYENSSKLIARIENCNKLGKDREEYKKVIAEADRLYGQNKLEEARELYLKASKLLYREQYPKNQLAKIDAALGKKKEEDAKKAENDTDKDDNKTAEKKESTDPAKKSSGGSGSKSSSEKSSDSSTPTVSWEELQRLERERKQGLQNHTYYMSAQSTNALSRFNETATLSGDFSSIEDIEREYRSKMSSLNYEANNLKTTNDEYLRSLYANSYDGASQRDQAIGQTVLAAGQIINSIANEQRKKEAQENLRRQREQAIADMKAREAALELQKKKARTDIRKKFLEAYPDGGTPLSSQNIQANEVYFFAYSADEGNLSAEKCRVHVTDMFPVGRYKDGTWIFKNTLAGDIRQKTQQQKITLIGYFTSKEELAEKRSEFLANAGKLGFVVSDIKYAGKKTDQGGSQDFWGNKTNSNTPADKTPAKKDDFWETGKSTPKTDTKKQPQKKDDFWDK